MIHAASNKTHEARLIARGVAYRVVLTVPCTPVDWAPRSNPRLRKHSVAVKPKQGKR